MTSLRETLYSELDGTVVTNHQQVVDIILDSDPEAVHIMWGPPGEGKTELVTQLAKLLNLRLEYINGATLRPHKFCPLPYHEDKLTYHTQQAWLLDIVNDPDGCILFCDETNMMDRDCEPAFHQIFGERRLGDIKIPDRVRLICAANPPGIGFNVEQFGLPMTDRLIHILLAFEAQVFVDYWRTQGAPETVCRFIEDHPEYLRAKYPLGVSDLNRKHPSPRSWLRMALQANRNGMFEKPAEEAANLAAGFIGNKAAEVFKIHLKGTQRITWKYVLDTFGTLDQKGEVQLRNDIAKQDAGAQRKLINEIAEYLQPWLVPDDPKPAPIHGIVEWIPGSRQLRLMDHVSIALTICSEGLDPDMLIALWTKLSNMTTESDGHYDFVAMDMLYEALNPSLLKALGGAQ